MKALFGLLLLGSVTLAGPAVADDAGLSGLFAPPAGGIPLDDPVRTAMRRAILDCVDAAETEADSASCVGRASILCETRTDLEDPGTACAVAEASIWGALHLFRVLDQEEAPAQAGGEIGIGLKYHQTWTEAASADCGPDPIMAELEGVATVTGARCWSDAHARTLFHLSRTDESI